MTDEPRRRDRNDDGTDAEVFTGEPLDALFEVEASGEVEEPADHEVSEPVPDVGSSFALQPQVGEALPPELRAPQPFDPELDLPDPTDPGFTRADMAGFEDEVPQGGLQWDLPEGWEPGSAAPPEVPAGLDIGVDGADEDAGERDEAQPPHPGPAPPPDEVDWEKLAGEDYVGSSTQEYLGLAAELEASRFEDTEQIAVSASMPGVDTGVVGLDDVAGETPAEESAAHHGVAELGLRIATGLGLLSLFFLSLLWSAGVAVLALAVFGLAAGEFYAVLVRRGFHPLSVFGLLGVAGCLIGAWIWGVVAIPIALIATVIAVALFYGLAAPREDTLRDASMTVVVAAWVGGLGAFAMPVITDGDYRWLVAGLVVIVASTDVAQYFAGRRFGRRPLAPVISPKKTVEGWIGGLVAALLVGGALSYLGPFDRMSALLLAGAAIVFGPIGDLAISMVKRTIGVKDMGTVLPGHGGILDRIDALLFVIPAAWLVFRATGLVG